MLPMFTTKDLEYRSIFVIHCFNQRSLRLKDGELLLEEEDANGRMKTLTKFPFQKILALFIVGNVTLTSPLIEKCRKFDVAIVVMKLSLRPVFFFSIPAEANFLLRAKQYAYDKKEMNLPVALVRLKIESQRLNLQKSKRKDALTLTAVRCCDNALKVLPYCNNLKALLGIEGFVAKNYFAAYFQDFSWYCRCPRLKSDYINVVLDIGYTVLFNLVEVYLRLFGFDLYVGVYHQLWFKRKSLVCDLVEPFRPIIDHRVRVALNRKEIKKTDFEKRRSEYYPKSDTAKMLYIMFFDTLIPYKNDLFRFVQGYYRVFMNDQPGVKLPSISR
ncbi:type V CRISPR-associated endonuclease Cas1 [Porphyromonas macacae]